MDEDAEGLVAAARDALQHAYAPYSGFPVGAAVLDGGGRVHTGCNVENASFGLSTCAERSAVFAMVRAGGRRIRAVAVACGGDKLPWPCGACLQVIREFVPEEANPLVIAVDRDGRAESALLDALSPPRHRFSFMAAPEEEV